MYETTQLFYDFILWVEGLRSCTNRLKPFQQGMRSSDNTNGLSRTDRYLVIFGKAAGIVEPGQLITTKLREPVAHITAISVLVLKSAQSSACHFVVVPNISAF